MTDAGNGGEIHQINADNDLVELMLRGEWLWLDQMGKLTDASMSDPSQLPGWDRTHLVAHMAGNARALTNLVTWAATGIETPMYPSVEARNQQIAELATLPPADLRQCALAGSQTFTEAWRVLPTARWHEPVRTFHGKAIDAIDICWLRARENHVHSVDLGNGATFADFEPAFLDRLLDDVALGLSSKTPGRIRLIDRDRDRQWDIGDPETVKPTEVIGSTAELAAWATGRGAGSVHTSTGDTLPALPAWL